MAINMGNGARCLNLINNMEEHMENPFNNAETRVGFLRLGYEEYDLIDMYMLFEKIRTDRKRSGETPAVFSKEEQTIKGVEGI